MLTQLLNTLDNQHELVIELQREMTSRPALGPEYGGDGELQKAGYLLEWLKTNGITDVQEYREPDARVSCGYRPSLIARVPGKTSRTLWIIGHTDIVPAGDEALWNTDPFTLHVEGDILQGRGVEDNQQAIVSGLLTAKALLEHNITPELSLGLLLVADEETGSKFGLDAILRSHPDLIAKDDLILIPDMGNPEGTMIEVAEKSVLWMKASVTGKQCHASRPEFGINSLVAAADLILACNSELPARFPAADDIFVPPVSTFVPSRKDANVPNVNTVPGMDVFYVDCRVMPQYQLEQVTAVFRELADAVEQKHGVTVTLEPVQHEQATAPTPEDADIVKNLIPAIKEVYGVTGKPVGIGGGTVAAYLRRRGYHCVVWSRLVNNAHEPNEQSRISYAIGDAKVITRILMQPV